MARRETITDNVGWLISPESSCGVSALGRGFVSAPGASSSPGLSIFPASPALQSWIVLTVGISGLHGIHPGYGWHLGSSRVVREVGRTFQAQLWKSNRINFASSDLTTVLWSKLCLNFKKRRAAGTPFPSLCPVGQMCFAFLAKPFQSGACITELQLRLTLLPSFDEKKKKIVQ